MIIIVFIMVVVIIRFLSLSLLLQPSPRISSPLVLRCALSTHMSSPLSSVFPVHSISLVPFSQDCHLSTLPRSATTNHFFSYSIPLSLSLCPSIPLYDASDRHPLPPAHAPAPLWTP